MAELLLPASLENLKIDLARDLVNVSDMVNPFSNVGGARKKIRRISQVNDKNACPLSLFGKKCPRVQSKSRTRTCECNKYRPSPLKSEESHRRIVQPSSVFKKEILRKSKLTFLKLQHAKHQCHHPCHFDSTFSLENRIHQCIEHSRQCSDQDLEKFDKSSTCSNFCEKNSSASNTQNSLPSNLPNSELFGNCVHNRQDFQSLVQSSQKETSPVNCSDFNTTSFKSVQKLRSKRHSVKERRVIGDGEDDDVQIVSKTLSRTEITPSSASCSQQARLTADAYCDEHDISIDELAGYFDDFVHIPKKMSFMAEQMYI